MTMAREAGGYQCSMGLDLADAVRRTVEATNMIEIALLEANSDEASPLEVISEIADLRSMLVMAVVSGYNEALARNAKAKPEPASKQLRDALMKNPSKCATTELQPRPGDRTALRSGDPFLRRRERQGPALQPVAERTNDHALDLERERRLLPMAGARYGPLVHLRRGDAAVARDRRLGERPHRPARRAAGGGRGRHLELRAAPDRKPGPDRRPDEQQHQPAAVSHAAGIGARIRQRRQGRKTPC